VLVQPHAALERDPTQPTDQMAGMDGRGGRLEDARQVGRRAGATRHLGRLEPLEGRDPEPLAEVHGRVPGAELRRRGRRPQVSGPSVVRVDAVLRAEATQRVDGVVGRRPMRIASSCPHSSISVPSFGHQPRAKPPVAA
jgi:hypothetical protein